MHNEQTNEEANHLKQEWAYRTLGALGRLLNISEPLRPTYGEKSSSVIPFFLFLHRPLYYNYTTLIIVQRDATQSSLFIILQVHSTCFGCQPHKSSVQKTVTTASGTGHMFCAPTFPQRDQASLATKHVEWTCRIINRLLCVASRWTIINIAQRCTEP